MTEATKPKSLADELRAHGYTVAPCPHCAQVCVWAISPRGSKIPLSPRIPVYTPIKYRGEHHAVRNELNFASHFFDCPQREKFRQ